MRILNPDLKQHKIIDYFLYMDSLDLIDMFLKYINFYENKYSTEKLAKDHNPNNDIYKRIEYIKL